MVMVLPFFTMAQRKPKIKGNRTVIQVREQLPAFNAIELVDNLDITLRKAYTESYEIEADENLIATLKFEVVDGVLVISSFYTVTAKKKFDITVNFKELTAIAMRDGKISCDDEIDADKLDLNISGPSTIDIKANAFEGELNMEGTAKGDFTMTIDSLRVSLKKRSDADILLTGGSSIVEIWDNGAVSMGGAVDNLDLKAYGNTKFKGEKLAANTIKAQVEASTVARVNAVKEIQLASRGQAKTLLYGQPKVTILEFLDTSQLLKKK